MNKNNSVSTKIMHAAPVALLLIALISVGSKNEYFFTFNNIRSIFLQASSLGLMAVGLMLIQVVQGIDLSIPSSMALGAILGALFMRGGGSGWVGALIVVLVPSLLGVIKGYAIVKLNMVPFAVTLAFQTTIYGVCILITKAIGISGVSKGLIDVSLYLVGNQIHLCVIFSLILVVVIEVFMKKSFFGRYLFLTGMNKDMARVCGIPTQLVTYSCYVISGFLSGLAGIIIISRLMSASASMGSPDVYIDILGASVIGGTSTRGGSGSAVGAFFGAVLLIVLSNAMNMLHLTYSQTLIVKGIVVIIFVAVDSLRRRRSS